MLLPDYTRFSLPKHFSESRLDAVLSAVFCRHSRRVLQQLIADGGVLVDETVCEKAALRVRGGQQIFADLSAITAHIQACDAEDIALEVVYEDRDIIVVNKNAGLVTHPGINNPGGTLQNALLFRNPAVVNLARCGIVHRLDKNTSGLLVAAKTATAQQNLIKQFKTRTIKREYLAVVFGEPPPTGVVSAPIGRSRKVHAKMAVRNNGKPATTRFAVEKHWQGFALLRCWLESGRTHQIRVHLEHIGYPIVGDCVYKKRARPLPFAVQRQSLHAASLSLFHPATAAFLQWRCALPPDILQLAATLDDLQRR